MVPKWTRDTLYEPLVEINCEQVPMEAVVWTCYLTQECHYLVLKLSITQLTGDFKFEFLKTFHTVESILWIIGKIYQVENELYVCSYILCTFRTVFHLCLWDLHCINSQNNSKTASAPNSFCHVFICNDGSHWLSFIVAPRSLKWEV